MVFDKMLSSYVLTIYYLKIYQLYLIGTKSEPPMQIQDIMQPQNLHYKYFLRRWCRDNNLGIGLEHCSKDIQEYQLTTEKDLLQYFDLDSLWSLSMKTLKSLEWSEKPHKYEAITFVCCAWNEYMELNIQ